jgi:Cytidylate kinase-like family
VAARVVCISRALGAEGSEIGRAVSDRLGYRLVDEEIVAEAAKKGQVDVDLVADAEERRSFARRILDELLWTSAPTLTPEFAPADFSSEPHRALIVEVIRETFEREEAVIVAHAASHALAGSPGVLRVLVTASPEVRARRLASAKFVDESQGPKLVRESDAARAAYLKKFYGLAEELPTHYDLVVNTDVLSPDEAADLVVAAARFALLPR